MPMTSCDAIGGTAARKSSLLAYAARCSLIPRAHAHACSAATCRSRTHVHSLALYSSARGCTPSRAVVSASGVGPPACSASCSAEASSPSDELLARASAGSLVRVRVRVRVRLGLG